MELRIDRLLATLRERPAEVLAAIDADPHLIKREVGDLVLANAAKTLFTPQVEHQLYAKGIVYRRSPYRLVSLPLLKIYNLGERNVTAADVAGLAVPGARLHFLRKFDGTMVQRFQVDGRVFFTTRGMIEGAALPVGFAQDEDTPARARTFDYLAAARKLATERYPPLVEIVPEFDGVTLILELLHPEARVITDYRGRHDLVLLAAFDRDRHAYWPYAKLRAIADRHGLTVADALTPAGDTLAGQIDSLLADLCGTDEEGTVLVVEIGDAVVYRVKIKSPDYLRLLRLMVRCTYSATVEMLDANPSCRDWPAFEEWLRGQGTDRVPEEVLIQYREHFDTFAAYRADCGRLRGWAARRCEELRAACPPGEPRSVRKAFADLARSAPHAALLFSALDGRLTEMKVREYCPLPENVRDALAKILPR